MSAGVRSQIDPAAWAPSDPARRRIEAADIAYARARRPRQGWQSLGLQLGLNAADLQRACEAVEASAPTAARPAAEAPKLPLPPKRPVYRSACKPGSGKARALQAIALGANRVDQVAQAARVSPETVNFYAVELRHAGFIGYKTAEGWPVTQAGWAEFAALNAAEAADGC